MNENDMKEIADMTVNTFKVMADAGLPLALASFTRQTFDAFVGEGFTADQAMGLTTALVKSIKVGG